MSINMDNTIFIPVRTMSVSYTHLDVYKRQDRNIELRLECDPEVGMVRMDASLVEHVLVNIIKNAAESIEGDAGENGQQGEIIVRTTAPASVEVRCV